MGTARKYHADAPIDGVLYAIGGFDSSNSVSSGERYDPAANAWSPIASMGTGRDSYAAVAL
jgi:kelch-like protein 17 (actinfilin)/kelch-like protein 20